MNRNWFKYDIYNYIISPFDQFEVIYRVLIQKNYLNHIGLFLF